MKRNDFLLLGTVLLLATAIFLCYRFIPRQNGDLVVVKENGTIIKTFPIEKNTSYTIHAKTGGMNVLQIKDGFAFVKDADCPDKLCVHQKKISKKGETLVCLPHKIVVSIQSASDQPKSNNEPSDSGNFSNPEESFDGIVQ